jgi:hypothetical protein
MIDVESEHAATAASWMSSLFRDLVADHARPPLPGL